MVQFASENPLLSFADTKQPKGTKSMASTNRPREDDSSHMAAQARGLREAAR